MLQQRSVEKQFQNNRVGDGGGAIDQWLSKSVSHYPTTILFGVKVMIEESGCNRKQRLWLVHDLELNCYILIHNSLLESSHQGRNLVRQVYRRQKPFEFITTIIDEIKAVNNNGIPIFFSEQDIVTTKMMNEVANEIVVINDVKSLSLEKLQDLIKIEKKENLKKQKNKKMKKTKKKNKKKEEEEDGEEEGENEDINKRKKNNNNKNNDISDGDHEEEDNNIDLHNRYLFDKIIYIYNIFF